VGSDTLGVEDDMRAKIGVLCLALAACRGGDDDSNRSNADDSSGTDDSAAQDDSGTSCTLAVVDTSPRTGADSWLYSDPLQVTFDEPGKAATFTLTDGSGSSVPFTTTWGEGATNVSLDAALTGSTTYALGISACDTTTTIEFTTSVYGSPLTIDPAALVGKTYLFDLSTAEYERPAGLGALIALYISSQVLLGVTAADASTIDLLGGQGTLDKKGMYAQDTSVPTFDFGGGDFTDAPYFAVSAPQVQIVVEDTYTMYDFAAEGTFAPDGSSIGGAVLSMLVDTTNLGDAMNLPDGDEPMAVCDYLEPLGIPCETCPGGKGKDNCIAIVATWDTARTIPVTLKEVLPPKGK
jgi:hypothetical protein